VCQVAVILRLVRHNAAQHSIAIPGVTPHQLLLLLLLLQGGMVATAEAAAAAAATLTAGAGAGSDILLWGGRDSSRLLLGA
jgi:hypothetical protein